VCWGSNVRKCRMTLSVNRMNYINPSHFAFHVRFGLHVSTGHKNISTETPKICEYRPYSCGLCRNCVEEYGMHLFSSIYHFSRGCWDLLGVQWNSNLSFFNMLMDEQQQFQHDFFIDILVIATRNIRR
jgi:hypothetical protein